MSYSELRFLVPYQRLLALALLLSIGGPCYAVELPTWGGWFGGDSQEESTTVKPSKAAGSREWWAKHKGKAVFVPTKGYQVEGYEGFFDANGKPMNASVDEITIKLTRDLDQDIGLLPGLDPKKQVNQVRDAIGLGPNEQAAQDALKLGVALFDAKKYGRAATQFEKAASRWPGSDLAAKALFNLGESYFFDEDYKEAADAYTNLLDKHPSTPRLNDTVERLWSIARYWEQSYFQEESSLPLGMNLTEKTRPTLDTVGHAVRLYEVIRLNDPTGPRADDAIMSTASIHFRRKQYHDADYHYSLLRTEYPRSEHQFEAHLLGLQAKLQKYQGPDYDGTPLDEAKQLEEKTRLNFSGRLNESEQDRLRETRAQLAASVEERDLRMAEYYQGAEFNGSAKIYLSKIIEERGDSPIAKKAREKLAEIADAPDEPPIRMAWFVDMFPENKRFESINTVPEIDAAADRTMVADGSKEAAEGGTATR